MGYVVKIVKIIVVVGIGILGSIYSADSIQLGSKVYFSILKSKSKISLSTKPIIITKIRGKNEEI